MKSVEHVLERLKAQGERLTIQRRLVVEALCSREGHLTIHEVQAYVVENHPGHDLQDPTVYRILQWLKECGLVSQTDMGSTGVVYELVDEIPHHHLVCLNCGGTIELDDDLFSQLRTRLATEYHFEARIEHMAIYGYCHGCSDVRESQP